MAVRGLTTKERVLLEQANPALARYVDEIGTRDWSTRLSALRKATSLLRAEREALQELAAVGMLREETTDILNLRTRLDAHAARMEALAGENAGLRKALRSATALPAMAVNAAD